MVVRGMDRVAVPLGRCTSLGRLLVGFALAFFLGTPVVAADTRMCAVSSVEGEAFFLISGERVAAIEGTDVAEASGLSTGAASRLEVMCDDGVVITLGPETEIAAEGLLAPTDQSEGIFLSLLRGITGIVAPNRTWDRFEVETDLAIASVRSTEWLVEHGSESGTAIFVSLGEVAVQSGNATRALSEGEGISVTASDGVGDIVTWQSDRVLRARTALGFGWATNDAQ